MAKPLLVHSHDSIQLGSQTAGALTGACPAFAREAICRDSVQRSKLKLLVSHFDTQAESKNRQTRSSGGTSH